MISQIFRRFDEDESLEDSSPRVDCDGQCPARGTWTWSGKSVFRKSSIDSTRAVRKNHSSSPRSINKPLTILVNFGMMIFSKTIFFIPWTCPPAPCSVVNHLKLRERLYGMALRRWSFTLIFVVRSLIHSWYLPEESILNHSSECNELCLLERVEHRLGVL